MRTHLAANLIYFPVTRLGGEHVRKRLKEYLSHDGLEPAVLEVRRRGHLNEIIRHASTNSPFYLARGLGPGLGPESKEELLTGVPLLEKADIRNSADQLAALGVRGRLERKTTSGSTGHPLTVLKDSDALARERAATWRAYSWAGIEVAAPQALLWGIPHTKAGRLKARVLDFLSNRRRLSMFGVTEPDLDLFHLRLMRFQPHYLYGYVSAIVTFIRYLAQANKPLPAAVKCIVTTSELLDANTRAFLQDQTGLPVFNEYGCGEVGSIAHECEHGSLHIMADNLALECVPMPGLPDGLGELVVTDLFNRAMPLIRYRLGDLGSLSAELCECGRPYPVLNRIVGRAYDIILDADGRSHHPESVLYVFEDLRREGIHLPPFQAVQEKDGELQLRFELPQELTGELERAVRGGFQRVFGEGLTISVTKVPQLTREASGKLRVVKRIRDEA